MIPLPPIKIEQLGESMKALSFEGSGMEYFKIWIVNVLLTIVTLGLYYPWAKVRNNRYFYANSTLEGRNFEYHATGKQLFIGYLIGMALFIAYVVIQQVSPTGSLIVALLFILALPWIIWRSMKFSMRMTSFSNVRFGFVGKLSGSYINFLVLPIILFVALYGGPIVAIVASFGVVINTILVLAFLALAFLIYAYMRKRNVSYMINGSRYGQGEFITTVETKKFAIIIVKVIGLSILTFVGILALIGAILYFTVGMEGLAAMKEMQGDPEAMQQIMGSGMMGVVGLIYLLFIIGTMLIMAYSITRQRTYTYENTTLDEKITFKSTLKAKPLAFVMVTNLLAIIFSLGLALPWAKVRLARLMLENTQVSTDEGFDAYITQKVKEGSALGDQIGDAFDVDVGLGF